jgi:hypothetical protein
VQGGVVLNVDMPAAVARLNEAALRVRSRIVL